MMDHASEFRRCLVECDVAGVRKIWSHVAGHLPQPKTDEDALIAIHHARTQAASVPARKRFYSHRWLSDRGLPSALPDELRPSAERAFPRIVEAVGIAVRSSSPLMQPVADAVHAAMVDAVQDAYASGRKDSAFVRARMVEARSTTYRKLLGKAFQQ